MTQQIQINPIHDLLTLGQQLQQNGRLQIPDFFNKDSAEYLHKLLIEHTHWYLAYNEGSNYYESPMAELQALDPIKRQKFMNNIYTRAQTQFQYVFMQYYITQAIKLNEQPDHPIHQMHDFMNSDATLDFMRKLTGESAIAKADSYASCYTPGHFLTQHDDTHDTHDRVAAYVFSMTKNWNVNWGGHLAFYDDKGNIEQAFIPDFNTFNIFFMPKKHAVQQVTPFAGGNRTSYVGWLQR